MALDKTDLFTLINTNLPDNTSKSITPLKHRSAITQVADSALNVLEDSSQTVAGLVNFTGGLTKSGSSVAIGAKEVEVLRAYSTATSQNPTTTGTALQVEFGASQYTSSDPVSIDVLGNVTFNTAGTYAVRVKLQAGRSGSAGTSILASRILINGSQVGVSAVAELASVSFKYPTESKVTLGSVAAGSVFTVQIVRDASGADDGGLYSTTLTTSGWAISPSALLVVTRIEAI